MMAIKRISSLTRISKRIKDRAKKTILKANRTKVTNDQEILNKDRMNKEILKVNKEETLKVSKTREGARTNKATARKIQGRVMENRARVTNPNRKVKERVRLKVISHKMVILKSNR